MSTIERPATMPTVMAEDEWYLWPTVLDWASYLRISRARGDSRVPRMLYLDGELFLMTPSLPHEERKERLGRFVTEVVVGLGMSYRPAGSTTWRKASIRGGVEGDTTFYIASVGQIRGKSELDLRVDPPPDLAIEVVYTHGAEKALEVYRRLGVPEVWVATEQGFRLLALRREAGAEPRYEAVDRSVSFPMLTAEEIADWVYRPAPDGDEAAWARELREWIGRVLAPRLQQP